MTNSNTKITGEVIEQGFEPTTAEEYLQETAQLAKQSEIGKLALAQRFYEIRTKKLFRPLYTTMREYAEEIKIDNSVVSRLATIHEKMVLTLGVKIEEIGKVGWTKIAVALPIINTKDEADHWMELAKVLSKADFKKEVAEARSGKLMADCKHEKAYLVRHCPDCSDKWREYDVTIIRNETLAESLAEVGITATDKQVDTILKSLVKKAYKHDPEPEE